MALLSVDGFRRECALATFIPKSFHNNRSAKELAMVVTVKGIVKSSTLYKIVKSDKTNRQWLAWI